MRNDENFIYEYNNTIIEPEKMNESLERVENEYKKLDEFMISTINMKFSMEISILVISTLLSILGLLGKIYIKKN